MRLAEGDFLPVSDDAKVGLPFVRQTDHGLVEMNTKRVSRQWRTRAAKQESSPEEERGRRGERKKYRGNSTKLETLRGKNFHARNRHGDPFYFSHLHRSTVSSSCYAASVLSTL